VHQKGTLDNGKGPNRENKSDANLSLFSITNLLQKGVRFSIDHKLKPRQGQLLKLSLWKILVSSSFSFGTQDPWALCSVIRNGYCHG
jgi:hypothetical protein